MDHLHCTLTRCHSGIKYEKSANLKGARSQYFFFINILNVTTGTSRENLKESRFEVIIQHKHDFLLHLFRFL